MDSLLFTHDQGKNASKQLAEMKKTCPPESDDAQSLAELFPIRQGFFRNKINLIGELKERKKKILKKVRDASPATSPEKEKDQVSKYITKMYNLKAQKLLLDGLGTDPIIPTTIQEEKANESELTVMTQSPQVFEDYQNRLEGSCEMVPPDVLSQVKSSEQHTSEAREPTAPKKNSGMALRVSPSLLSIRENTKHTSRNNLHQATIDEYLNQDITYTEVTGRVHTVSNIHLLNESQQDLNFPRVSPSMPEHLIEQQLAAEQQLAQQQHMTGYHMHQQHMPQQHMPQQHLTDQEMLEMMSQMVEGSEYLPPLGVYAAQQLVVSPLPPKMTESSSIENPQGINFQPVASRHFLEVNDVGGVTMMKLPEPGTKMDLQSTSRDCQNPVALGHQSSDFRHSVQSKKDSIKGELKIAMHQLSRQESSKKKRNGVSRRRMKLIKKLEHLGDDFSKQDIHDILLDNLVHSVEIESNLSVQLLKNHIRQNHPLKTNDEWWPLMSDPGALLSTEPKREIPDFVRDIGLGPALYLLTLKSLGKIFLSLTILNIPSFIFFYSGTESTNRNLVGMSKFFAQFSLGNLGEQGLHCSTFNFAQSSPDVELSCSSGTLSHIVSYGLKKDRAHTCDARNIQSSLAYIDDDGSFVQVQKIAKYDFATNLYDGKTYVRNFVDYHPKCSTITNEATKNSQFTEDIIANFDSECLNETKCKLQLDYSLLNQDCRDEIEERALQSKFPALANKLGATNVDFNKLVPEPDLFIVSFCKSVDIEVVLMGITLTASRKTIGALIVLLDIFSLGIMLVFINLISIMQIDFAKQFDDETVEMRDFTLRSDKLPEAFKDQQDEVMMKFSIWEHIQEKITDAKKAGICKENLDPTVVEINFGIKSNEILNHLMSIDRICERIKRLNIYLRNSKTKEADLSVKRKIFNLHRKLKAYVEEYRSKYKGQTIFDAIALQEKESLFDQIVHYYITFLSMDTKELVQNKLLRFDAHLPKALRLYYSEQEKKKQLHLQIQENFLTLFGGDQQSPDPTANVQEAMNKLLVPNKMPSGKQKVEKKESSTSVRRMDSIVAKMKGIFDSQSKEKEVDKKVKKQMLRAKTIRKTVQKKQLLTHQVSASNMLQVTQQKSQNLSLLSRISQSFPSTSQELIQAQSEPVEGSRKLSPRSIRKKLKVSIQQQVQHEITRVNESIKTWPPVDPEYILWQNIGYSSKSRQLRRAFSMLVASLIIIFSVYLVLRLNDWKESNSFDLGTTECEASITKLEAYEDAQLPHEKQRGFMNCFCYSQLMTDTKLFLGMTFQEFGEDTPNYCAAWFSTYSWAQFIVYGSALVVVTINIIAQEIFIFTAQQEKQYNTALENQSIFTLIFIQQYINIGIVLIFSDQKFIKDQEFDTVWYIQIGSQICLTMLIQTFSTKGSDLARVGLHLLRRFYDRGFNRKIQSTQSEDFPNTRQVRQNDIQALYTGTQIRIGYKFAQSFTFIFVCLSYSAGLPILYPITTVYFLITYWFDKVCLMRFYQKTKVFNEELPIHSINLFKYAIITHFIFAGIMYSSSTILMSQDVSSVHFEQSKVVANVFERLSSPHQVILLSFIIICGFVYVYQKFFVNPITVLLQKYLNYLRQKNYQRIKKEEEAKQSDPPSSEDTESHDGPNINIQSLNESPGRRSQRLTQDLTRDQHILPSALGIKNAKKTATPGGQVKLSAWSLGLHSQQPQPAVAATNTLDNRLESQSVASSHVMSHKVFDPLTGVEVAGGKKSEALIIVQDNNLVESDNLYKEILFDSLEVYYQNHTEYLKRVLQKQDELVENENLSPERFKIFEKYVESVWLNIELIEQQIDMYYTYLKDRSVIIGRSEGTMDNVTLKQGPSPTSNNIEFPTGQSPFQRGQFATNVFFQENRETGQSALAPSNEMKFSGHINRLASMNPYRVQSRWPDEETKQMNIIDSDLQNESGMMNESQQYLLCQNYHGHDSNLLHLSEPYELTEDQSSKQIQLHSSNDPSQDVREIGLTPSEKIQLEKVASGYDSRNFQNVDKDPPSPTDFKLFVPKTRSDFMVKQANYESQESAEAEGGDAEDVEEEAASVPSCLEDYSPNHENRNPVDRMEKAGSSNQNQSSNKSRNQIFESLTQKGDTPSSSYSVSVTSHAGRSRQNPASEEPSVDLDHRINSYLNKLDFLNDNFDEDELHLHTFPNNFRCASFSQTYNMMDNPQFNEADQALEKAELLLINPFLFISKYRQAQEEGKHWKDIQ